MNIGQLVCLTLLAGLGGCDSLKTTKQQLLSDGTPVTVTQQGGLFGGSTVVTDAKGEGYTSRIDLADRAWPADAPAFAPAYHDAAIVSRGMMDLTKGMAADANTGGALKVMAITFRSADSPADIATFYKRAGASNGLGTPAAEDGDGERASFSSDSGSGKRLTVDAHRTGNGTLVELGYTLPG